MARYLVTGGCGFIGSHLVQALLAAGHEVRVLDDLSSGRREQLPDGFQRLIELASPDDVTRDADGFLVAFDTAAGPATRHTIAGSTLTFYPAPAYTGTLGLWYAAGYPYDDADDIFTGLTGQAEDVVMLRAQANALRVLASATAAGRGLNYRIGDVSIQRPTAQPHSQLAGEMDAAYADACRAMTGFIGARASYSGWERLQ